VAVVVLDRLDSNVDGRYDGDANCVTEVRFMSKAVLKKQNKEKNGGGIKAGPGSAKDIGLKVVDVTKKHRPKPGAEQRFDVVPENGKWVVKSAGSKRAVTESFEKKSEAIDEGLRLARTLGNELVIHGRNGQPFEHSPVPSDLDEDLIRKWVRSMSEQGGAVNKSSAAKKRVAAKKK
jgi:hypothetical protein